MSRVSCVCVLALQLCLLLYTVLPLTVGACTGSSLCDSLNDDATDDDAIIDSVSLSLSCDNTIINVTTTNSNEKSSVRIELVFIELACAPLDPFNHTNKTLSLVCNGIMDRFQSDDLMRTLSLNVSREGIMAGSVCNIRGCSNYDYGIPIPFEGSCVIPYDCEWGPWSEWSECDAECGGGEQTRSRLIAHPPVGGGRVCTGLSNESRSCNTEECAEIVSSIPTVTVSSIPTATGCSSTAECSQNEECVETQCTCVAGYQRTGSHCTGTDWKAGITVMMAILVIVVVVSAVGMAVCCVLGRKRRGLDHKRLEKLMGTFDPNFTPHLSYNLRKVTAVSEVSVFDNLWLHRSAVSLEREYITLDELGIHIHSNQGVRNADSENSVELRVADYGDEETRANMMHEKKALGASSSHVSHDLDSRSNYSLDLRTVQMFFQLGHSFQNTGYDSDKSVRDDVQSVESEPRDFVEDLLRIDIEEFSESEQEEQYLSADDEPTVSEPIDFVEGALRISIDDEDYQDEESQEYLNVEGVCFTLPAGELVEQDQYPVKSSDVHSSLSALDHHDTDSDDVGNSTPLSNSTPSLFVS